MHRCTDNASNSTAPNCVCRKLMSECLASGRHNASKMPFPFHMYLSACLLKTPTLVLSVLTKASLNRRLPDKLRAVTYLFSMRAAPMARPSLVVMLMLSRRKSALRSESSTTFRGRIESSSHALSSLATPTVSAFRMVWAHQMNTGSLKCLTGDRPMSLCRRRHSRTTGLFGTGCSVTLCPCPHPETIL